MIDGKERLANQRQSLFTRVHDAWQPVPIPAPAIEHDLHEMMALERIAQICRYRLLQAEHVVSPGGGVRAWLRVSILLALALFIPALFVMPALILVAQSLEILSGFVLQTTVNFFDAVVNLIATVAAALAFVSALKVLWLGNGGRVSRRR